MFHLAGNPKDRFSHDVALMSYYYLNMPMQPSAISTPVDEKLLYGSYFYFKHRLLVLFSIILPH